MLDAFLEVSYSRTKKAEAQSRLTELMMKLPDDVLEKIASGEEKLGYGCGDDEWLAKFQGTPLAEEAMALAQHELQAEMERSARSREQRQMYQEEDETRDMIRIKKKMLDLQLMGLNSGVNPEESSAEEEVPVEAGLAPPPEGMPQEEEAPPKEGSVKQAMGGAVLGQSPERWLLRAALKDAALGGALGGTYGAATAEEGKGLKGGALGALGGAVGMPVGGVLGGAAGALGGYGIGRLANVLGARGTGLYPLLGALSGGVLGGTVGGIGGSIGGAKLLTKGTRGAKKEESTKEGSVKQATPVATKVSYRDKDLEKAILALFGANALAGGGLGAASGVGGAPEEGKTRGAILGGLGGAAGSTIGTPLGAIGAAHLVDAMKMGPKSKLITPLLLGGAALGGVGGSLGGSYLANKALGKKPVDGSPKEASARFQAAAQQMGIAKEAGPGVGLLSGFRGLGSVVARGWKGKGVGALGKSGVEGAWNAGKKYFGNVAGKSPLTAMGMAALPAAAGGYLASNMMQPRYY